MDKAQPFKPYRDEAQALSPPPKLTVSQWADERRVLQSGTSRQPGPWRTDTTPYLRAILDAYNDPDIRHLSICAGTQLGKTETIYNILGFCIDVEPFSTLLVYPREDDAKTISRSRLQPMIRACPTLASKLPEAHDMFQTLEQHYPGMTLYLVGANSAAALSQKPCRNILRDEIDKYPDLVAGDADPLSLSEARAKSFWDIRKVVDVSSPTIESRGIWKQLQSCEVVKEFEVYCPHCGVGQVLQFEQIQWESPPKPPAEDVPPEYFTEKIKLARKTATYACEGCGAAIENKHRQALISSGRWVNVRGNDENAQRVGFRISSLYSPWLSWGDVAESFIRAHAKYKEEGVTGPLQDFQNGWCALPWKDLTVRTSADEIQGLRTNYPKLIIPKEGIGLTCAIDTQQDGFWFETVAWGKDKTSWLIDCGYVTAWEDLESILFDATYETEDGEFMRIWRAGIDTGGTRKEGEVYSRTEEVYNWLRVNGRGRGCPVFAMKGSSQPLRGKLIFGKPIDKTPSGKAIPGGLVIVRYDPDKLKDELWWRIARTKEGNFGGMYVHEDTPQQWFQHITAEERVRDKKGREKWQQIKRRANHLLDCRVMGLALADPEFLGGIRGLSPHYLAQKAAKEKKKAHNPADNLKKQHKKSPNPFLKGVLRNPFGG